MCSYWIPEMIIKKVDWLRKYFFRVFGTFKTLKKYYHCGYFKTFSRPAHNMLNMPNRNAESICRIWLLYLSPHFLSSIPEFLLMYLYVLVLQCQLLPSKWWKCQCIVGFIRTEEEKHTQINGDSAKWMSQAPSEVCGAAEKNLVGIFWKDYLSLVILIWR